MLEVLICLLHNLKKKIEYESNLLQMIFFLWWPEISNDISCIFYVLSLPTELSSQRLQMICCFE